MAAKVDVRDERVWVRLNFKGTRKSICMGPDTRKNRIAAQEVATKMWAKLMLGDTSPLSPAPEIGSKTVPLFRIVSAEWLETYPRNFPRRSSTMQNYQSTIDARLVPYFGDWRVSAITRQAIQEWVATVRTKPDPTSGKTLAYSTLVGVVVPVLRLILDYCVEREWIAANPFRVGGKMFEPSDNDREAKAQADPFSAKEMVAILGAARMIDPAFELLLRTWSQCGARSGEVRGLLVKDLDLKKGRVSITQALNENDGEAVLGPTKNLRGRRVASLLAFAVADDQPAERLLKDLAKHVKGKKADDYIFTRPSDGTAITFGSLKERWRRALDLAGVRFRSVETLRHTHVSGALSAGENPLSVAERAGHTPAIMLSHYAAHVPAERESIRTPRASQARRRA